MSIVIFPLERDDKPSLSLSLLYILKKKQRWRSMPDAVPGELVAGVAAHPTGRIEYVVALVPSKRVSLAKKKLAKWCLKMWPTI